jgi:hypothetical protein
MVFSCRKLHVSRKWFHLYSSTLAATRARNAAGHVFSSGARLSFAKIGAECLPGCLTAITGWQKNGKLFLRAYRKCSSSSTKCPSVLACFSSFSKEVQPRPFFFFPTLEKIEAQKRLATNKISQKLVKNKTFNNLKLVNN